MACLDVCAKILFNSQAERKHKRNFFLLRQPVRRLILTSKLAIAPQACRKPLLPEWES
jgi:hypothetical protein